VRAEARRVRPEARVVRPETPDFGESIFHGFFWTQLHFTTVRTSPGNLWETIQYLHCASIQANTSHMETTATVSRAYNTSL
jgi:hypothetical protein